MKIKEQEVKMSRIPYVSVSKNGTFLINTCLKKKPEFLEQHIKERKEALQHMVQSDVLEDVKVIFSMTLSKEAVKDLVSDALLALYIEEQFKK